MSQQEIIDVFKLSHKNIDEESLQSDGKYEGYGYHIYFDYSDCSLDIDVYSIVDGEPFMLLNDTVSAVYDIIWEQFQDYQLELKLDNNDFKYIY